MGEKSNHYKVLGLPPNADEKEIRSAYRNLAKKYHPDAGAGSSSEKFHDIQHAYKELINSEKRTAVDFFEKAHETYDSAREPYVEPIELHPRRSHVDLRGCMTAHPRACAGPLRFRGSNQEQKVDPWDRIMDLLLRGF
jgi:curved DNA-binding protein CbpA